MKKLLNIAICVSFVLTSVPLKVLASYDLTENETKISRSFISDGITLYAEGDLEGAIRSFTQVLLIDPHNIEAQKYLSAISKAEELTTKQKMSLFRLEDLYANINSLKSRIDYFENMRNMLGRRLVTKGMSSEDLAQQMVNIKTNAIHSYNDKIMQVQTGHDTGNPLDVLNDALEYEKQQLAVKSYYLTQQYESMRKMDPSFSEDGILAGSTPQSKYKQFKHTNRFYTSDGERILQKNTYNVDIDLSKYDDQPDDIRKLKRHIALIRREMNILQDSISGKESKIQKLTDQLVDASLKATEKENRLQTVEKNLNWQNDKIVDLSSRLDLSQHILSDKNQEIQTLQDSFNNVKKDLNIYHEDFTELLELKNKKIVSSEKAFTQSQDDLNLTKQRMEMVKGELSNANDQVIFLEGKLEQSDSMIRGKDQEIREQVGQLVLMSEDLKETQQKLESKSLALRYKEDSFSLLQDELALLESRVKKDNQLNAVKISKLKDEIMSLLDQISDKDKLIDEKDEMFENLQIRYDKQSLKLSKMDNKINDAQERIEEIKTIAESLKVEKDTIEKELGNKKRELKIALAQSEKQSFLLKNQAEMITEKDSLVNILDKERTNLSNSVTRLEKDLVSKQNQLDKIHAELFDAISLLSQSKTEKNKAEKLLSKYEKDLDLIQKTNMKFGNEILKKDKLVSTFELTLAELGAEKKAMEHLLKQYEKDNLSQSKTNLMLGEELAKRDGVINEMKSSIKNLNDEKLAMEGILDKYKKDLSLQSKTNFNLKDELDETASGFNENKELMDALQTELSEANKILKNHENNDLIAGFRKDLKQKDVIISKMENELEDKNSLLENKAIDISSLKNQLSVAKASLEGEIKAKERLTSELAILRQELKQREQIVKDQDKEMDALQYQFETAQKEVQSMDKNSSVAMKPVLERNVLTPKDKRIAELQRELQALENVFNSTKITIQKQKKEIAALKTAFEENYHADQVKMAAMQPPLQQHESASSAVDSVINDLITLNSEIIKLQGTYTNKKNLKDQQQTLQAIIDVLSRAKRITRIMEDKANAYIMTQGHYNNELKGILDIYKDKLTDTNASLKESEATVLTLKDQIAFAQKQLFEKDKLLKKTQNDLLTLEEELTAVKQQIKTLKEDNQSTVN